MITQNETTPPGTLCNQAQEKGMVYFLMWWFGKGGSGFGWVHSSSHQLLMCVVST
jgi:hypothetical protein